MKTTTQDSEKRAIGAARREGIGAWRGDAALPAMDPDAVRSAIETLGEPVFCVQCGRSQGFTHSGTAALGAQAGGDEHTLVAYTAPLTPDRLGDAAFLAEYGVRYAYVAGAMANGIASEDLVIAMARGGMLSFFGAAGLSADRVRVAIDRIQAEAGDLPYGFNLIHSPNEPALEDAIVDLYLEKQVRCVEASAFLQLTPALVRYRLTGAHRDAAGNVVAPNRVMAKISREEIAEKFMAPAPEKLLRRLVEEGQLTDAEAELAASIPIAQDITAEADSGGHTDHRPAIALLPTICTLRDRLQSEFAYAKPLRVGLAGGISTPESAAAAFAMGAAYIVTGSVNQACVESGASDTVRGMLAEAGQADVTRAPAADMFEMGVTLQVLKRGTMFSMRAGKLYELYRACDSLEAIPAADREKLEKTTFGKSLDAVWEDTRRFFSERDPRQIERAEKNPKHKMALVFRWYLGQSSHWANAGDPDRIVDYQVWCGPAMGAFNAWTRGTLLERRENRRVVDVARQILRGAAVLHRADVLKRQGAAVPESAMRPKPVSAETLGVCFDGLAHARR